MGFMLKTWLVTILLLFGGVMTMLFMLLGGQFGLPEQVDIVAVAISAGVVNFLAFIYAVALSGRKQAGFLMLGLLGLILGPVGAMIVSMMPGKKPELPSRAAGGRAGSRLSRARA